MRYFLLLIALFVSAPAFAQVSNPGGVSPDQLAAVQTMAASKCDPTVMVPPMETTGGVANVKVHVVALPPAL